MNSNDTIFLAFFLCFEPIMKNYQYHRQNLSYCRLLLDRQRWKEVNTPPFHSLLQSHPSCPYHLVLSSTAATRHKELMSFSPGKICSQPFTSLLLALRDTLHTAAKSVHELLPKRNKLTSTPPSSPKGCHHSPCIRHSCCATTAQIRYGKSIRGIKKMKQNKKSSHQIS